MCVPLERTVHSVRQQHAVPVDRGVLRELVGDKNPDAVAFHDFDGGAGGGAVVAPAVDDETRRELALHRLGDQMEFLHAAVHRPWQGGAVERDHGCVRLPAARREWRLRRWRFGGGPHGPGGLRERLAARQCGCARERAGGGTEELSAIHELSCHWLWVWPGCAASAAGFFCFASGEEAGSAGAGAGSRPPTARPSSACAIQYSLTASITDCPVRTFSR